jgi:peptidyl-prolyl cis-trans isomerase C
MPVEKTLLPFLREPLTQFLLIGAVLFGSYRYFQPSGSMTPAPQAAQVSAVPTASNPDVSRQIVLTIDQLTRLATVFVGQWGREPTARELGLLVDAYVREEILYREALAMGLDKDDEIVRRRMAQKMQFLAEDVAAAHKPTDAELRAWFDQNNTVFKEPSRLSFRHLYFSPDRRGDMARANAETALTALKGEPPDTKFPDTDAFMFQNYYRDRTPEYLRKEFGPPFTAAMEKLPGGSWQGPVESGFGWHLVFIDTVIPAHMPAFEEIEPDVRQAWLADQKANAENKAYEGMRAKYTVLMQALPPEGAQPPPKVDSSTAVRRSIPYDAIPK